VAAGLNTGRTAEPCCFAAGGIRGAERLDLSIQFIANGVLDKMQEFNHWTDQRSYVRKGWETAKQQLAQRDADYTREKCSWVATEWKNMEATMRVK
jgi:hypothetical protein